MDEPINRCQCGCGEDAGYYAFTRHTRGVRNGEPRRFCQGHATRGRELGEKHPSWKGGRSRTNGYNLVKVGRGYKYEHRLVMEKTLGRPLGEDEDVHHIDGDKLNNDPSNLKIWSKREHSQYHNQQRRLYQSALLELHKAARENSEALLVTERLRRALDKLEDF